MSILNQFIPLIISRMEGPATLKEATSKFLKQLDNDLDDNGFTPGTEITQAATEIDQALIKMDEVEPVDTDNEEEDNAEGIRTEDNLDEDEEDTEDSRQGSEIEDDD